MAPAFPPPSANRNDLLRRIVLIGIAAVLAAACSDREPLADRTAVQNYNLEETPDFSWEISVGKLRREIALGFERSYGISLCFEDRQGANAMIVEGRNAFERLQDFHGPDVLDSYKTFLQHPASFAVEVAIDGLGEFIVVPHPNTTTLDSPSVENFISILPLSDGDSCLQLDGTRGSNGGPIDEWCKCSLTSCTPNCTDGCSGTSGHLEELGKICTYLEPFTDDRPLYILNIGGVL